MKRTSQKQSLLRRLSFKMIEWLAPEIAENVKGDLDEMYHRQLRKKGRISADFQFLYEVFTCLKLSMNKRFIPDRFIGPMINLKMSWRILIKNKEYAFINILGLTVGFAASLIIFLFVRTEYSYDKYHDRSEDIYRIAYDLTDKNEKLPWAISKGKWPDLIMHEFPAVENMARIIPTWGSKSLIKAGNEGFYEEGLVWADSSITQLFNFELLQGKHSDALNKPHTMIISEGMANKYFGGVSSAIGKTLNRDNETDYTVTGVYKSMPSYSHFHADFIASLMSATSEERYRFWGYNYVKLKQGTNPADLVSGLPALVDIHEGKNSVLKIDLQPLEDIYLKSEMLYEFEPVGSQSVISMFSVVGVFILLIACINFINLSTAYGARRIKEIGIKKVLGAYRSSLVSQLITEGLLITFFSIVLAGSLVYALLPAVEWLAGNPLNISGILELKFLLLILLLVTVIGVLAGSYPAFYIASFKPKRIFEKGHERGKSFLRKSLTVFQFGLSITLIIGSIVIYKQLQYFQEKDMGMKPEQALVIPLEYAKNLSDNYEAFRTEILRNPHIKNMSMMSNLPGELIRMWTGDIRLSGTTEEDNIRVKVFTTDYDFVKTLGVRLTKGRDFSRKFGSDSVTAVLINQTAAHRLGGGNIIGSDIHVPKKGDFKVIGIVEDFHFASLHNEIEPLVIYNSPGPKGKLVLSLDIENMPSTIEYLENTWANYEPDRPMESFFLNEYFNEKYTHEKASMNLIISFTSLAVFIACLGLFGLATYVVNGRSKEIGIRKVFGASVARLFILLASEFAWLVLLAFMIISPIAYYLVDLWLTDFAYRIDVDFWIFGLAGLVVLIMAIATVSYRSLYVAKTNPTRILSDE